jgi:nitrous oxide reductase
MKIVVQEPAVRPAPYICIWTRGSVDGWGAYAASRQVMGSSPD